MAQLRPRRACRVIFMAVFKMKKCPACIGMGTCTEGVECPGCEGAGEVPSNRLITDDPSQPVTCSLPRTGVTFMEG